MNPGSLLISGMNSFCTRRAASLEFVTPSYRRTVKYALLLILILRVTYVLCYLPGRGRFFRHAFAQRNWWTVCRFQVYFNARPQPPGLSGTVTFTAALPENLGKVTWDNWFFSPWFLLFSRPRPPPSSSFLGFLFRRFEDEGR